MNISLGRILGISAAAVALTIFGFTAQAQTKKDDAAKKPPKPPACKKVKDETACKARDDCIWRPEVKDAKGKVKKKAVCKKKPKPKPEKKPAAAKKPAPEKK